MRLFDLFARLNSRSVAAQLAAELVRRSQMDVAAKIEPQVEQMSIAEARGYLRARATPVLEQHMHAMIRHPMRHPTLNSGIAQAALLEDSLERTIVWVVGQKLTPTRGGQRRLAA